MTIGGHRLSVGAVRPKGARAVCKLDQRESFPQTVSVNRDSEPTKPAVTLRNDTKLLVASLALAVALPCSADSLDLAVVSVAALDLGTTEWVLHKDPGLSEGNPLGPNPAVRAVGKTLTTAGIVVVRHELKKRGHGRAAKVLGIAAVVLWGGAAAHNYRMSRRER